MSNAIRVLYSFPHKIGAQRICYAAWQHVQAMADAGAEVLLCPGVLSKKFSSSVTVLPTLSRGKLRIPYKLFGRLGACAVHDWIVSRRLKHVVGRIDLVHSFPLGSLRTLREAKRLGIPTILERCNAHTAYAYKVVQDECARLGITMPPGHEHDYNPRLLRHEELEYSEAKFLFCPSEFVARTFIERGFPPEKLARFQYGFDEHACYPAKSVEPPQKGLTVLFAAGCAPRKGLHFALEAWVNSSASKHGKLLVAGVFIPGYAEKLSHLLKHPSVECIGFRKDLADVMRRSDVFVLPSIEEGSALVTYDARGCGCVLLVSDASGAVCKHMENCLVHPARDVKALTNHFNMVDQDRELLGRLRQASLATADQLTWKAAGRHIVAEYQRILQLSSTPAQKEACLV